MAGRGPVPKRSTERRRRNKESKPEVVPVAGAVEAPKANGRWHPIAKRWYESLVESGQAQFYEPSDWALAQYVAEAMSRNLRQQKFSSVLFAAVLSSMSDLLVSEGARRRARIEIERANAGEQEQPAGVTALADYKKSLGA